MIPKRVVFTVVFSISQIPAAIAATPLKALYAWWQNEYGLTLTPGTPNASHTPELLTRAPVDECYDGGTPPTGSNNSIQPVNGNCASGDKKWNEAYVWSTETVGTDVWWGSMANTFCVIDGGTSILRNSLTSPPPAFNESFTRICEYDQSWLATTPGLLPAGLERLGDWRPPKIRVYDTTKDLVIEVSDDNIPKSGADRDRVNSTLGFRSMGVSDGYVIVAGATLAGGAVGEDGINVFFFRASDRSFVKSCSVQGYNDIRNWVAANGSLYAGVRTTQGRGAVLRWTGNKGGDPCRFANVGNLDNMGADIVFHQGRLYVGTWPDFSLKQTIPSVPGIYQSPPVPAGGLNTFSRYAWKKIWSWANYEPDLVARLTMMTGPMVSHQGYLYWSGMQQPGSPLVAALVLQGIGLLDVTGGDGNVDPDDAAAIFTGSKRPTTLFRASNLESTRPRVELLYGNEFLPTVSLSAKTYTAANDLAHRNRMFVKPKWGKGGYNCIGNFYTWSMMSLGDKLYLGTADETFFAYADPTDPSQAGWIGNYVTKCPFGADLYRIDTAAGPAVPENLSGLGKSGNGGIRTLAPSPSGPAGGFFVGTTNNNNLGKPGGWELIRMNPLP